MSGIDYDGAIAETFGATTVTEPVSSEADEESIATTTEDGDAPKGSNPADEKQAVGDGDDSTKKEENPSDDENAKGEGEKKADGNEKSDQKPKKNRYHDRIKTLTDRNRRLREDYEALQAKVSSSDAEKSASAKPDPDKYTDQRQYDYDMGRWIAQQEFTRQRSEIEAEHRTQKEIETYRHKVLEGAKKYDDFEEKVGSLEIRVTQELHNALQVEDNAADLLYFFGDHPDIAEEILSLPSYRQAKAIASICDKIRNSKAKPATKSNAAPPEKKVQKAPVYKKDPRNMTAEEWAVHAGYMKKSK